MSYFKIFHGAAEPIVARGRHQADILSFAFRHRGPHWTKCRKAIRAANALAKRDCMTVERVPNDRGIFFTFKYPDER